MFDWHALKFELEMLLDLLQLFNIGCCDDIEALLFSVNGTYLLYISLFID
jgi:hypothetical protein